MVELDSSALCLCFRILPGILFGLFFIKILEYAYSLPKNSFGVFVVITLNLEIHLGELASDS